MKQRISILGCGWLGLALASELIDKGYEVFGSTTSSFKITQLAEKGIKPFLIDLGNTDVELMDFLHSEVLIIAITSKSIEDIENLIKHIVASEVQKVLFISSTSVYPFTNGIVTEETVPSKVPLSEIEKLFITNTSFKSTIIRFGGLFGYDRIPGRFFNPNKPIENPEGYVNLIHRDDCIEIMEQIILKDLWNEVLNACADTHPKRREFYLQEIQKTGKSEAVFNENSKNEFKIINSQKLKTLLNYEFKHADLMNIGE